MDSNETKPNRSGSNADEKAPKSDRPPTAAQQLPVYAILAIILLHLAIDMTSTSTARAPSSVEKQTAVGFPLPGSGDRGGGGGGGPRCVGLGSGEEIDRMIAGYDVVYVVFPAEAGGGAMREFSRDCLGAGSVPRDEDVLEKDEGLTAFLRKVRRAPPFLSSRLLESESLVRVLKQSIKNSLTIYLHREESDRLTSAVRAVAAKREGKTRWGEDELMTLIRSKEDAIGNGSTRLLNCDVYRAVEDNAPNLVFLHHREVEKLMELLARNHCPGSKPPKERAGGKTKEQFVTSSSNSNDDDDDADVGIDEWLEAKSNLLEHTLGLKKDGSCTVETRKMEHDLLSCPDGALHYSNSDFFAPLGQIV